MRKILATASAAIVLTAATVLVQTSSSQNGHMMETEHGWGYGWGLWITLLIVVLIIVVIGAVYLRNKK